MTSNTLIQHPDSRQPFDWIASGNFPLEQLPAKSAMDSTITELNPIVLLIDDTPANLQLLIRTLTEQRFRLLVAESGHSALERVRYALPDIILLDVLMPEMNGFETCKRLKANPATADIPVLFLTALDDMVDKIQGFLVGGVDYITKPLHIPEVLARVNTHLTLRRLQQKLQRQNEQLEAHVQERTAGLQGEIERRKRQEAEKNKLLDVLGKQSDQLRDLTTWLATNNQQHQNILADTMVMQVEQNLELARNHVAVLEALLHTVTGTTERQQLLHQLTQLSAVLDQIKVSLYTTSVKLRTPSARQEQSMGNPLLKLSAREREVLQLVLDGKSNADIAELLYLSETTVRTHRSRILHKLELSDTRALIKFAIKHQLTSV